MKAFHTIISGIDKLSLMNESLLSSISSFEYKKINDNELKKELNSCDIFWFRLNHKLDRKNLHNIRCKYIICAVTGLDHIDIKSCNEFGIKIISLKCEFEFLNNIRATAEHTIALTFSLLRKLKYSFNHVESGNWDRTLFKGNEIFNKNVGILGFGRLGKLTAKFYNAFGANVKFYDKEKITDDNFSSVNSIDELFSFADILSIHIPYSHETHHLISMKYLKLLNCNSIVINTSRGGVINENDLCNLIINKKISGYAADVIENEPNITSSLIYKLSLKNEKIILTPHIGGNTYESIEKTESFVLNKLINILKNKDE